MKAGPTHWVLDQKLRWLVTPEKWDAVSELARQIETLPVPDRCVPTIMTRGGWVEFHVVTPTRPRPTPQRRWPRPTVLEPHTGRQRRYC